jgi:hypothetical protein
VLDHTGLERNGNDFAAYDLVLTIYGTLRRDAWRCVPSRCQCGRGDATNRCWNSRPLPGQRCVDRFYNN